jgi:hypothetical protein
VEPAPQSYEAGARTGCAAPGPGRGEQFDWIKGQVTSVECGILSFEAVFLPYMLTADGRPLVERIGETELLPKPETPEASKVVNLPARP